MQFFSTRFIRKKLQSIFVRYNKDSAKKLMSDAKADLIHICEQSVASIVNLPR